jgi:SAM-dependent methyltransferase
VPPDARLTADEERARYALHRNNPDDDGYRRFLSRLVEPLLEAVPLGAEGLDFGCGPQPVLAQMLTEQGRRCVSYDPFFAPDRRVFERRYDFICASEVLEHIFQPVRELQLLFDALRPGGILAIMTGFAPASPEAFAAWHYIRDPTHVCFYSPQVFRYVGDRWNASLQIPSPDVVLLQRGA